jgi:hypothetical protein
MNLRSTEEHESTGYTSLWKREVRRDFYDDGMIKKSPLSPLYQRGVFFGDNYPGWMGYQSRLLMV